MNSNSTFFNQFSYLARYRPVVKITRTLQQLLFVKISEITIRRKMTYLHRFYRVPGHKRHFWRRIRVQRKNLPQNPFSIRHYFVIFRWHSYLRKWFRRCGCVWTQRQTGLWGTCFFWTFASARNCVELRAVCKCEITIVKTGNSVNTTRFKQQKKLAFIYTRFNIFKNFRTFNFVSINFL